MKTVLWTIIVALLLIAGIVLYRKYADTPPPSVPGTKVPAPEPSLLPEKFPLKTGSRGPEVRTVQRYVNQLHLRGAGELIDEDGIWGARTQEAVKLRLNLDQISEDYYQQMIS